MKNLKSTIISTTAIASLTASSLTLAIGIETVLPEIQSDSAVSVTSNKDQYGPTTILDHVKRTLEKSNTEINVDSNTISVLEDIKNIRDVL